MSIFTKVLISVNIFSSILCSLHSAEPQYYKVLAQNMTEKAGKLPATVKFSSSWRPGIKDRKRGFTASVVGPSVAPRPDYIWQVKKPEKQIKSFVACGEFRAQAIALRSLNKLRNLRVIVSDLSDNKNNVLKAENFNIQCVKYLGSKSWNGKNCFLVSKLPELIQPQTTSWLWLTLHAPRDAKPGIYQGKLTISANNGKQEILSVTLRVLNAKFQMPPIAAGTYLPGHFWSTKNKGQYVSYCPKWWTAKNLNKYLSFLKTRGFNSPVLYHVYPEISYINGKVNIKFPFLNKFAAAMKQEGMIGPLGVDTRFISWWANHAARKLATLPKGFKGDLKIYGSNGYSSNSYSAQAKELYGEAIEALCQNAKEQNWPEYLLLAEEEIGFPTRKTIGYDAFMPILKNTAGVNKVFLVDNAIGYPGNLIDRGERDNLKVRSYNNWTQKGLQDARNAKAQIWSYNMKWDRSASGYYLELIGATGYHQWADAWLDLKSKNNWYISTVSDNGVISSVELERTHEGFGDLFWFRKLDFYIEKLKSAGHKELSAELLALKKSIFAGAPVKRYKFFSFTNGFSDKDYDLIRWKCICAINKAKKLLGEAALFTESISKTKTKKLATCATQTGSRSVKSGKKIIYAPEISYALKFNGKDDDKCWHSSQNRTERFVWTGIKEAAMRARAGNEDEFKNMPGPSSTSVGVAYNKNGIYIFSGCNHVNPKSKCIHPDDSPQLWADDCMEFFFRQAKTKAIYQLIVNAKGKRVLLKDKTVVKNDIKTATIHPLNGSGGVGQEIFIPWKDLGLNSTPSAGTVWQFNACREFHSWNQLACWAQVHSRFGLADGLLCFNGPESSGKIKFKSADFSNIYLGQNRIKSKLSFIKPNKTNAIILKLRNAKGSLVTQSSLPRGSTTFLMNFKVPAYKSSQTWTLQAFANAKLLGSVKIPIMAANETLKIIKSVKEAFSNDVINLKLHPKIANLSLKKSYLIGYFKSADKKQYSIAPCLLNKGNNLLSISTKGLKAGKYKLILMFEGFKRISKTVIPIKILPSPY